jgi:hypothetical protein
MGALMTQQEVINLNTEILPKKEATFKLVSLKVKEIFSWMFYHSRNHFM